MRAKTKTKIWRIIIGFVAVVMILGMVVPFGFGF